MAQNTPCIFKVPQWIKGFTNCTAYIPQTVSLGPFHNGEQDLKPMEEMKEQAKMNMVNRSGKQIGEFEDAIRQVVPQLKSAYEFLEERWREDQEGCFVNMMVKDGCFLLEMGRAALQILGKPVNPPSAPNVQDNTLLLRMLSNIKRDMVIMDNQLPMLALFKLQAVHQGSNPTAQEINDMMLALLGRHGVQVQAINMDTHTLHPLDLLHRTYCHPLAGGVRNRRPKLQSWMPSAVELHQAGIKFIPSNDRIVANITFSDGILRMPLLRVHGDIEECFLNMLAYEKLYWDAGDDLMSYVYFTNNLIKSAADVALLRSKGVVIHTFGSDEAVAALFSTLSKGTVMSPCSMIHDVQRDATAYHKKRWNQWRASIINTNFRDPLVFISFMAATILLITSILQTIFAGMSLHR